jgi:hypothetical protein
MVKMSLKDPVLLMVLIGIYNILKFTVGYYFWKKYEAKILRYEMVSKFIFSNLKMRLLIAAS